LGWWGSLPAIGIFTSPIYNLAELARLGGARLYRERGLSAIQLLGSLAPRRLLRRRLRGLVVQTQTTRGKLLEAGLWDGEIGVIPPGVDDAWRPIPGEEAARRRRELGFDPDDIVAVYFGPPSPLRGVPLLLKATAQARQELPALKLLLLSRQRPGELEGETMRLKQLLAREHYGEFTQLVSAFLPTQTLAGYAAACDLAALPFELVPSDAPLGLLEARALGLPLVTTRLACLPELAEGGRHALAEPGEAGSLSAALLRAATALRHSPDGSHTAPRPWRAVGEEWEAFLYQQLASQ
jgi:glycosyltransferase involved in cell wall biosynthesis